MEKLVLPQWLSPAQEGRRYHLVADQLAIVKKGEIDEEGCGYEQVIEKLTPRFYDADTALPNKWRIVWKLTLERVQGVYAHIDVLNMRATEAAVFLPVLRRAVDDCLSAFPQSKVSPERGTL